MNLTDRSAALVDLDRMGEVWERAMGHDGNGRDVAAWVYAVRREHPTLTGFALSDAVLNKAFASSTFDSDSDQLWLAVATNTISAMFHDWHDQRAEWVAANEESV